MKRQSYKLSNKPRKKWLVILFSLGLVGLIGFLVLTSPWTWTLLHSQPKVATNLSDASLENGRRIYLASDCATCHASHQGPLGGEENDEVLGGGKRFDTPFGIFYATNISPHKTKGIGSWSLKTFDRAMRQGVAPSKIWPDGMNLYPVFPYTSYQRLAPEDVRDLYAYMMTLPEVEDAPPPHELSFPFNLRRGVGVWRLVFLDGKSAEDIGVSTKDLPQAIDHEVFRKGRYLVESAAHCVECHSPRGLAGNIPKKLRYAGGESPVGAGYIPNITPDETGIAYWSAQAIENYLATGVNPTEVLAMGDMAEIVKNKSQLAPEDLHAMATYLKYLIPIDNKPAGTPELNYSDKVVLFEPMGGKRSAIPTSKTDKLASGQTVHITSQRSFQLTEADDIEAGTLLSGATGTLLEEKDGRLKVELKGWQPNDSSMVLYQEKGKRILMAVINEEAQNEALVYDEVQQDTASSEDGLVDESEGEKWRSLTLTAWIDSTQINLDLAELWDYSAKEYLQACTACHSAPRETDYTANQWIGTMNSMKHYTTLNDDEYNMILTYLQNHARDFRADEGANK